MPSVLAIAVFAVVCRGALSNSPPTFDVPGPGGVTTYLPETTTGAFYEVVTTHSGGPVVITISSQTPSTPVFTIAMTAAKKADLSSPGGLDAAVASSYDFVFSATDGTFTTNSDFLAVHLIDVNENPVFSPTSYTDTVVETATAGWNIGAAFGVTPSGDITVLVPGNLHSVTTPTYTLTVQVTDQYGLMANIPATVTITVLDVDECALELDNCDAARGICTNTAVGYTCTCKDGYQGNGITCADEDECALGIDNCDAAGVICTNTAGGFTFTCKDGYQGDPYVRCEDVDECALGIDNCDAAGVICTNTAGGFTCTCKDGYQGDPYVRCKDVDECALGIDNCDTARGICTNTDGSFTCGCPSGYELASDGSTCNVDFCVSNPCLNFGACVNSDVTYQCTCTAGWTGTTCGEKGYHDLQNKETTT